MDAADVLKKEKIMKLTLETDHGSYTIEECDNSHTITGMCEIFKRLLSASGYCFNFDDEIVLIKGGEDYGTND